MMRLKTAIKYGCRELEIILKDGRHITYDARELLLHPANPEVEYKAQFSKAVLTMDFDTITFIACLIIYNENNDLYKDLYLRPFIQKLFTF